MKKLYSTEDVQEIIDVHRFNFGRIITIEEGSLGYGTMILFGEGLKTTIIKEVFLNEWSSVHTIRSYNKCPKKYEKYLTF